MTITSTCTVISQPSVVDAIGTILPAVVTNADIDAVGYVRTPTWREYEQRVAELDPKPAPVSKQPRRAARAAPAEELSEEEEEPPPFVEPTVVLPPAPAPAPVAKRATYKRKPKAVRIYGAETAEPPSEAGKGGVGVAGAGQERALGVRPMESGRAETTRPWTDESEIWSIIALIDSLEQEAV